MNNREPGSPFDPFRPSTPPAEATISATRVDRVLLDDLLLDGTVLDGPLADGPAGPGSGAPKVTVEPLPVPRPKKQRRRFRRVLKLALALIAINVLVVLMFNVITPPRTAFMLQGGGPVVYQYVSLDHISRYTIAATIAHEDQQLGTRIGAFPITDFTDRATAFIEGNPDPTGSTIPQQLVKNIFLWPGRDPLRKGLEAGLATEFSFALSPQRVMELYLNYAQFGPKLYGVCAASWYYFDEPPWQMSQYQADQLMGVLPMPDPVRRARQGGLLIDATSDAFTTDLINGAANVWVPSQLAGMGGWEAAVATLGITDSASDHSGTQNQANACSTMPQSVTDRLTADGF